MIRRMASRVCWSCDTKSHMTRRSSADAVPVDGGHLLQAGFSCDECGRWSIAIVFQSYSDRTGLNDYIDDAPKYHWLPEHGTSKQFLDVPEHISDPASEAHRCRSIQAHRATILLTRAVIEAIAKDKEITSGTLYEKIEEMSKQGLIRAHVAEAAHEARHLGNGMAHGDFEESIDEQDADDVLVIMDDILLEVYQSPAKTKSLRERRAARKAAENG